MDKRSLSKSSARFRGTKVAAAVLLNVLLFTIIGASFYTQDLRYSLPTPKPAGFKSPRLGTMVTGVAVKGRPTLLCFASPDCGCSRFNQDHLWELSKQFGTSVRIVEVVEAKSADGLESPGDTVLDPSGMFAKRCGVYGTPQAVILNSDNQIVYRGNFNATRFCASPKTQFVRIALEAIVANQKTPDMPIAALTPYGCAITFQRGAK